MKHLEAVRKGVRSVTFNRTIKELKLLPASAPNDWILTFNRTIKELKPIDPMSILQENHPFNRTIKELKP